MADFHQFDSKKLEIQTVKTEMRDVNVWLRCELHRRSEKEMLIFTSARHKDGNESTSIHFISTKLCTFSTVLVDLATAVTISFV